MSDSGDAWPEDPMDPRCPDCGEPVSATANYCMHCEADLPGTHLWGEEGADDTGPATGFGGSDAVDAGTVADAVAPDAGGDEAAGRGWLHPDGLFDNVTTVGVGVVAGLFAGVLAALLVAFALPGGWPFLVGGVGWLAAALYVARTRTAPGAVRKAGYLLAQLLAMLPVFLAATAPMQTDTLGNRVGVALILAVFVLPFAAGFAIVGYLVGRVAGD